ncbi:MAG: S8 family serine peptidase [Cyanobacteriota bacterium]
MDSVISPGYEAWAYSLTPATDKSLTPSWAEIDRQPSPASLAVDTANALIRSLDPTAIPAIGTTDINQDCLAELADLSITHTLPFTSPRANLDRGSKGIQIADELIAPSGAAQDQGALTIHQVDNAGNTLATARNIGTLSGAQSFSDWVGSTDTNDFYRFSLSQSSNFNLSLNGLSSDADVQLLNSAGSVLVSSTNGSNASESISRLLAADTYYIRVYPYSGNTSYSLSLSATPSAPLDQAGNTLATARDIGTLSTTQSFSDWVGRVDTNDYYRLVLSTGSNFSLSVTGLSADADVQLLNSGGSALASSTNSGTSSEAISQSLSAGTYYVRVYPYSGATSYTLTLSSTASPPPPPSGDYSSVNGYGEVSVERAIEQLLDINIADLAPQFSGGLYGLDRIGAPEVWSQGFTGAGIVVAICDTGVDRNHPDLDANIWSNAGEVASNGIDDDGNGYIDDSYGWNFISNNNNTSDVNSHGTHLAGTIAGENNSFGVTGVAYGARVMPVKVLSDSGSGSWQSVANGIRYAADNGAHIINLSLGGDAGDSTLQSAIQYAWNRGVAVIMAAGNDGYSSPGYPAAYASSWGMAVGAVDSNGSMASFSNRSGSTPMNYVTAAGVGVLSTVPNNGYATYDGTSMATPHMAGAMALLMQANLASNLNLNLTQLEQLFIATASNSILAAGASSGSSAATGMGLMMADGAPSSSGPPSSSQPVASGEQGPSTSATAVASQSAPGNSLGQPSPLAMDEPLPMTTDIRAAALDSAQALRRAPGVQVVHGRPSQGADQMVDLSTAFTGHSRRQAISILDVLTGQLTAV